MSRLNDLLRELRTRDPALARDLEREVAGLADRRAFGLNFERHVPEAVELPGRRVRKGDKVRVLPPRGQAPKKSDETLWRVVRIDRIAGSAVLEAHAARTAETESELPLAGGASRDTRTASLDDLVVVAEFRDPIYPGLVSTGKAERGGDKPYHVVINAENFYALETLLFTHRGRVDCIYIWPFAGFQATPVADVKRDPMSLAIWREPLVRGPASKMVEVSVVARKAASFWANGRAHARGCALYAQTSVQAINAMQRAA